jgi:hypothetical protein
VLFHLVAEPRPLIANTCRFFHLAAHAIGIYSPRFIAFSDLAGAMALEMALGGTALTGDREAVAAETVPGLR